MDTPKTLMDRLKIETEEHHQNLESLPFFTALFENELPFESYVGFLRTMSVVHAVLEHELSLSTNSAISSVWQEKMRRLPFLANDLSFTETRKIGDVAGASNSALQLAERIRLWSDPKTADLLGGLYVLQGSALGAQTLLPRVSKLFDLRPDRLSYLSSFGPETRAQWQSFKRRMNAVDISEPQRDRIVDTAGEVFQGIAKIVSALYPIEGKALQCFASTLNPEAGAHPVTSDPRELLAAMNAGERTWNAFPYLEWRYGDRGKRFTRSDSAWLVSLSTLSQRQIKRDILWLGKVLASRGMPRFLLQTHIEHLHAALVQAIPERRHRYDRLLRAAEELHASRRKQMSDTRFQTLTQQFETMVGPAWRKRLSGTGALLVAAVTDEQAGIKRAVTSLEAWMTDSKRFPNEWIEAVKVTIDEARGSPDPASSE